jgi:hypothetical protein
VGAVRCGGRDCDGAAGGERAGIVDGQVLGDWKMQNPKPEIRNLKQIPNLKS